MSCSGGVGWSGSFVDCRCDHLPHPWEIKDHGSGDDGASNVRTNPPDTDERAGADADASASPLAGCASLVCSFAGAWSRGRAAYFAIHLHSAARAVSMRAFFALAGTLRLPGRYTIGGGMKATYPNAFDRALMRIEFIGTVAIHAHDRGGDGPAYNIGNSAVWTAGDLK